MNHAAARVHAVGPHPFWGGRPQALHVAITPAGWAEVAVDVTNNPACAEVATRLRTAERSRA